MRLNRITVALLLIFLLVGLGLTYIIYENRSKSWYPVLNFTIDEKKVTPLFNIREDEWRIKWEIEPIIEIVEFPRNQTMFTIEAGEWSGLLVYDKNGTSVSTISIPVMELAESNWRQKNGEGRWTTKYGWSFDVDPEVYGVNYIIPGKGDFYIGTIGIYNSVILTIEAYY